METETETEEVIERFKKLLAAQGEGKEANEKRVAIIDQLGVCFWCGSIDECKCNGAE